MRAHDRRAIFEAGRIGPRFNLEVRRYLRGCAQYVYFSDLTEKQVAAEKQRQLSTWGEGGYDMAFLAVPA